MLCRERFNIHLCTPVHGRKNAIVMLWGTAPDFDFTSAGNIVVPLE